MGRSDVNALFPGRRYKASPDKAQHTERNQDYPMRFVRGASRGAGGQQSGTLR
jgi:hypothetical protein